MLIYGRTVHHDGSDYGINHLYHLDASAAEVYFDHAKHHGPAEFEDSHGRKFVLEYHHDGSYSVTGR